MLGDELGIASAGCSSPREEADEPGRSEDDSAESGGGDEPSVERANARSVSI